MTKMPMENLFTRYSDIELVAFIKKKEERAFEVLYRRYYPELYRKAYQRIQSPAKIEEILQDVFLNLWVKASDLSPESNVRAYLYGTLRNRILHELRTAYNRQALLQKVKKERSLKKSDESLQKLYLQETESELEAIIETLSPKCKQAFSLSRFNELSYKEIAEEMNISVKTVEKHISKALSVLNEKFYKNTAISWIGLLYTLHILL